MIASACPGGRGPGRYRHKQHRGCPLTGPIRRRPAGTSAEHPAHGCGERGRERIGQVTPTALLVRQQRRPSRTGVLPRNRQRRQPSRTRLGAVRPRPSHRRAARRTQRFAGATAAGAVGRKEQVEQDWKHGFTLPTHQPPNPVAAKSVDRSVSCGQPFDKYRIRWQGAVSAVETAGRQASIRKPSIGKLSADGRSAGLGRSAQCRRHAALSARWDPSPAERPARATQSG